MIVAVNPVAWKELPIARIHGPAGYANYKKYKAWLRDDFEFRCVYCLEREMWYPSRSASFGVDHVWPRSMSPELEAEYYNLVYSCHRCNSFKRAIVVLDPTIQGYGNHLRVLPNGEVESLTRDGSILVALLHLNAGPIVETRKEMIDIIELYAEYPDDQRVIRLFMRKFGYPPTLPNLSRSAPPQGNSRPEGVLSCHYARRSRQELPEYY